MKSVLVFFLFLQTGIFAMQAPYGSWKSPITAESIAAHGVKFLQVKIAQSKVYWLEGRPSEGGRVALLSWSSSEGEQELLPIEYSVRTRVHEYGGGALLIGKERIYFIRDQDQQIYALNKQGEIKKITAQKNCRFADGSESPIDGSLYYVMEDHNEKEVKNSVVRVDPLSGKVTLLAIGHDFYSNPRVSGDGEKLAFIAWDHPNLPWDETKLYLLDLRTKKQSLVAGEVQESIVDPFFSPGGKLFYVSDRTGWWNIYNQDSRDPFFKSETEFASPHWVFDDSCIGIGKEGLFCTSIKGGANYFSKISWKGEERELDLPFTDADSISVEGDLAVMIARSFHEPSSIVLYNIRTDKYQVLKKKGEHTIERDFISEPIALEFPTVGNRHAHAFYYPPKNPHFQGPKEEKPPLLVISHGGPTGHSPPGFNEKIFFWTSRGYAVVDVNYGGSSGFGRAYRDRLKGTWGVVDVDDCSEAALYCARVGLADINKLAIEGGSAGGYTTLAALTFRDVFKVGADYFGLSDLETFVYDTHKFEARYLDQLIGAYPEKRDTYIERSPLHHADQIKCPVIIFQGAEDKIVPPSQSEVMYQSLLKRKIPVAYFLFDGEQHGFRKAETIQKCLDAQVYFFSMVMGIPLQEEVPAIKIENL